MIELNYSILMVTYNRMSKHTSGTKREKPNLMRRRTCSITNMAARPGSILHFPSWSYSHTKSAQLVQIDITVRNCKNERHLIRIMNRMKQVIINELLDRPKMWICAFILTYCQNLTPIAPAITNHSYIRTRGFSLFRKASWRPRNMNTWNMLSQAPTVAAARGTGRLSITNSFKASVLISIRLFWTMKELSCY